MSLPAFIVPDGSGAATAADGGRGADDKPVGGHGNISSGDVIRCLTPYLIDRDTSEWLSSDWYPQFYTHSGDFGKHTKTTEALYFADGIEVKTYESESGRFRLLYTTEGPDSVWTVETGIGEPGVPDYIVLAAHYADSSYRYLVEQLGYINPLDNTRCNPSTGPQIDIVFGDIRDKFGRKIYGSFEEPGSSGLNSTMFVHSTFSDPAFLRNDDADSIAGVPRGVPGALKVTIAHELKHAIQYATNCWQGDAGTFHWMEMDATMMENVVFPNVNDYYNNIRGSAGIFGNPQTRFPRAYSHVTFMLYYHEDFGPDFWVDVWDLIGDEFLSGRNIPMLEAMERVIEEYRGSQIADMNGTGGVYETGDFYGSAGAGMTASTGALPDLEQSLLRNYLWHLASGDRSLFSYGFSERENYPTAQVAGSYSAIPEWPDAPDTVPYHGARFFEFRADEMDAAGEVVLALFNSERPLGLGFLGKTYNGEVLEFLLRADGGKLQKLAFPVDWNHLDWLGLVAMNTAGGSAVNRLQLLAGEGPAIERIPYGNITRSGALSVDDAQWMLSRALNPATLSPFDYFLADVTGNGSVTPYDAARVLMNLDSGAPFPPDDNLDNLGPEWSRFEAVEGGTGPPAAPLWKDGTAATAESAESKTTPPDTLTAELVLLETVVLAEQKMDIQLRITGKSEQDGGNAPNWSALYLELELDFPPDDGGMSPGDPITLEVADLLPGNTEPAWDLWKYDVDTNRLRMVYASSGQLVADSDPAGLMTLRIIPMNEGHIHFRIRELRLDEYDYAVSHPGMDTIRVMGPVFADRPDDTGPEQPLAFALEQNYPNPFNPETMIRFTLPEAGQATLQVYDITGRRVATLVDGFLARGEHQVRFDALDVRGISSGVYVYRLTAAGGTQTRKMTVVK